MGHDDAFILKPGTGRKRDKHGFLSQYTTLSYTYEINLSIILNYAAIINIDWINGTLTSPALTQKDQPKRTTTR